MSGLFQSSNSGCGDLAATSTTPFIACVDSAGWASPSSLSAPCLSLLQQCTRWKGMTLPNPGRLAFNHLSSPALVEPSNVQSKHWGGGGAESGTQPPLVQVPICVIPLASENNSKAGNWDPQKYILQPVRLSCLLLRVYRPSVPDLGFKATQALATYSRGSRWKELHRKGRKGRFL